VFVDRDGTLIEEMGYLNHVSRLHLFPFVPEALRRLNVARLPVILISNQSGVGRGFFPQTLVKHIHDLMTEQLKAAGAHLDGIYYCPHVSNDNCECRKPKPGMLEQAARQHGLDLGKSFVIGDRYVDVELAQRAGARSILVRTGYGEGELLWHKQGWPRQPDWIANNFSDATDWILGQSR